MVRRRSPRRGFSVLELVIVLATVSVLSSIAIPNLTASFKRARSVEALQHMTTIERSLVEYYNRNGEYPRDVGVRNPPVAGYSAAEMNMALPGWRDLAMKPEKSMFRYRYKFEPLAAGGAPLNASERAVRVIITAEADTDNDGQLGTFVRVYEEGFNITPSDSDTVD